MELTSSKFRSIGKFKITMGQLEHLASEIVSEEPNRPLALYTIEVRTENSTIKYEDIREFRDDRVWDKDIEGFSLRFREIRGDGGLGPRTIVISGGEETDNRIFVSGEAEGWVVGMLDVAANKMKRYEVWYSKLVMGDIPKFVYYIVLTISLAAGIVRIGSEFVHGYENLGILLVPALLVSIVIALWAVGKISTRSMLIEEMPKYSKDSIYAIAMIILTLIVIGLGVVDLLK